MMTKIMRLVPLLLMVPSTAYSQGLTIDCFTVSSGGGRSVGSLFELQSSIGQIGSAQMSGGSLSIESGFLAGCGRPFANPGTISNLVATPGFGRNLLSFESQGNAPRLFSYELSRVRISNGVRVGAFFVIAAATYTGPGSYSVLDAAAIPDQEFEYLISERYFGSQLIPRATVRTTTFSNLPVPNTARVQASGTPFQDVDSAIAAATGPNWVVTLSPGTYSAFSVDDNAPANLRILSDGTGLVQIDTSSGPVSIQNRGPGQGLELRGIDVGDALSTHPAVRITNSQGVVILDSCLLQGGLNQPGVELDNATSVALQRCDTRGTPGLLADNGSVAVAGRGALDTLTLAGQSDVTVSQLTVQAPNVGPGSTFADLAGVMPDLQHPAFTSTIVDLDISLETAADGIFAVLLSSGNDWAQIPGFEFPLLLSPAVLVPLVSGFANSDGESSFFLDIPAVSGIAGQRFATQALSFDPATSVLRFSNALSFVIVN